MWWRRYWERLRAAWWHAPSTAVDPTPPADPALAPPPPEPHSCGDPLCEVCHRPMDKRVRARMRLRGMVKARQRAADGVNNVLARLAALELRGAHPLGATQEAANLEELMGCDFYYLDADFDSEALAPGDKFSVFNTKDDPSEVEDMAEICWPLDTAGVLRKEADEVADGEAAGYMFHRLRTVSPLEVRGHVNLVVPKMVQQVMLKAFDDGSWYTNNNYVGLINGRWRPLDVGIKGERRTFGGTIKTTPINSAKNRNDLHNTVSITMSLALTRRYSWHVALGNTADGPRVLLPTNPNGCLQFFKNRDKGNQTRRAALRHWVARHYRDRVDAGVTYVRDHLRGATEFGWSDLACEIFVSQFDLEKNEAFKHEADLWRSQRKHNSVKVRLKRRAT